ncbi:hypothetical protein WMY93_004256 [Mugilogobius chulae]|uniref:Uncharacterized protein n=1 Tax=Mugilogobius chulae TaxID=88201 RepID=A0AAW0PUF3_9GOBI
MISAEPISWSRYPIQKIWLDRHRYSIPSGEKREEEDPGPAPHSCGHLCSSCPLHGALPAASQSAQLAAMLKPADPSASAFLKVDPSYLQHWQQLFPQTQLKPPLQPSNSSASSPGSALAPPLSSLPAADRLALNVETLRSATRLHLHAGSSGISSSTQQLGPQVALFGQALAPVCLPERPPHQPGGGASSSSRDEVVLVESHAQNKEASGGVGVVSSSVKSVSVSSSSSVVSCAGADDGGKSGRFKLTSEELDYYLYGQQRMEIIPLSNHQGEPNNRT